MANNNKHISAKVRNNQGWDAPAINDKPRPPCTARRPYICKDI